MSGDGSESGGAGCAHVGAGISTDTCRLVSLGGDRAQVGVAHVGATAALIDCAIGRLVAEEEGVSP